MNPLVSCPRCEAMLLKDVFNHPEPSPCPSCGVPLRVEVFPALFRAARPAPAPEELEAADESSCFYHPQKRAVRPCDGCGRFLCALCDCALRDQHFCPACLEAGKSRRKLRNLDQERVRYDDIALALSVAPMLIFYLTLITAPMAIYVAIRYWNAPPSLVGQTRARAVAAILLALLQITGWIVVLVTVWKHHPWTHG